MFISHANPEDNNFVRWLGLQLTREGYAVWSDITKLIGGETFWAAVEDAIRNHTAKFVFVLSRASYAKQGPLEELSIARTVAKTITASDFIIPLRIDDIPFGDINVALHRLNAIDCGASWADGLYRLLEKLQKDEVPKDAERFNATSVASWWKAHCDGAEIIKQKAEEHLSNWFAIERLPPTLYIYETSNEPGGGDAKYPTFRERNFLLSFASASDLGLGSAPSRQVATDALLNGGRTAFPFTSYTGRDAIVNVLRQAWQNHMAAIGLPLHRMSKKEAFDFTTNILAGRKRLSFDLTDLLSGQRSLVGQFRGRTWHFALSADVYLEPRPLYAIYSHVLFSEDGTKIWESDARLHRARRTACKDWWNQHWRDRLLAAVSWIAKKQDGKKMSLPLGSAVAILVPTTPMLFTCPIGYEDSVVTADPSVADDRVDDESLDAEGQEGEA